MKRKRTPVDDQAPAPRGPSAAALRAYVNQLALCKSYEFEVLSKIQRELGVLDTLERSGLPLRRL